MFLFGSGCLMVKYDLAKDDVGFMAKSLGYPSVNHLVDVFHNPIPQRQSHAIINVNPEFFDSESKQKKVFKFLQKALARLASINGWTLRPGED